MCSSDPRALEAALKPVLDGWILAHVITLMTNTTCIGMLRTMKDHQRVIHSRLRRFIA